MEAGIYELDIEDAIRAIRNEKAKITMIQLPDGLKKHSDKIQKVLEEKTGTKVLIWADTCYGSCDTPLGTERLGVDLLIHFGHTPWKYN